MASGKFQALRVAETHRDTDDSVVVTFDPPAGEPWTFAHGQHLTLRRSFGKQEARRSYSLCSPAPDGPLRVAIKRIAGGLFSNWANDQLRAGDSVDVLPPAGSFTHTLEPASSRSYGLVAAGSGITPILSILSTILKHEPDSRASLIYINQNTASTMLLDELEGLRNRHLGRLSLWYVFTREPTLLPLLSDRPDRERLEAFLEHGILPPDADHYFACGPMELVENVTTVLTATGADNDQIHRELFYAGKPAPRRQAAEDADVIARGTVTLGGRTTDLQVRAGERILDAVARVRRDAPYSCRAGVCATCRALLREGEVKMDTVHGIEPDDVERGYILTCQAEPLSGWVVVDYDR